ncbi:DMT family transporter [Desulfogranum mediterraneum]|uniref:DMT family transporter n=1 Tax=Desulfogranum mediterraneum TaxID=160661 RepID=UPI000425108E|nr:EamA family transporter [Desulfogranum mediterraneum]
MSKPGATSAGATSGVYLRLVLTMIFWGGTFVAGRIATAEIHPVTAASGRFLLASLLLLLFIYSTEGRLQRLSLRQWGAMALLGLSGIFAYNLFFFAGLQRIEAGRGAMIIAANPVITTLLAMLFFGERFNLRRSFGICFSAAGALVVISRGDLLLLFRGEIGAGELCFLGAVLSWTAYTLVGKRVLRAISPLTAVTYSCLTGSALLLPTMLLMGKGHELLTLSLRGGGSLLYLAFFGTTLGFIWFYQGVRELGAGRAVLFVNLVPVCGVVWGILLLNEGLDLSLLSGGALVLIGLLLLNYQPRAQRSAGGSGPTTPSHAADDL